MSASITPKLAICVTFCDQDKYIESFVVEIEKLANRSAFCWELLVGLDDPTQHTREIVSKFCDRNNIKLKIKVFEREADKYLIPLSRASLNRLFLLENAEAPYAMLIDGDDLYLDVVDDAINILEQRRDIVGVSYNYVEYFENSGKFRKLPTPYQNGHVISFWEHCSRNKYIHSNCVVFRRYEALKSLKGKELYCNDTTLTKALLSLGEMIFVEREIMLYRKEIPSIYSGASETIKIISELMVQEENLKLFPAIRSLTKRNVRRLIRKSYNRTGRIDVSYETQSRSRNLVLSFHTCDLIQTKNPIVRWLKKLWLRILTWKYLSDS